jgi:two-component system, NtrC family, nitrogen regulation sensor histidine kinase NtrY
MKLRTRLLLAFLFLALASVLAVGLALRASEQDEATRTFDARVNRACGEAAKELRREAERDAKLVDNACHSGEFIDRIALEAESGRLDESRLRIAQLVPSERAAFGQDELLLGTSTGDVLGADPRSLLGVASKELEVEFGGKLPRLSLRTSGVPAWMSRCRVKGGRVYVGVLAARHVKPQLERIGSAFDVGLSLEKGEQKPDQAHVKCELADDHGARIPLYAKKSNDELRRSIDRINQAVVFAGGISVAIALVLAVLLARSLGGPIADLAIEARKVATGEARPLRVQGTGEVRDLVVAFDSMLSDLARTRRRLADASRVAAWREVARRVAHEVKNPLAPIQAAVETLRRLRARNDPAFDDYFDEASTTVLEEVRRIANIVTEFTRFARLPAPKPEQVDLHELCHSVLSLQRAATPNVAFSVEGSAAGVRADRGQIVQVVTNLVQNACDAVKDMPAPQIQIHLASPDATSVSVTVKDNGPGLLPAIAARLFEPYATTKAHGTGLGLAIAQRIAIEHNGDLSYVERPGEGGAWFQLTLPIAGPEERAPDSSL